MAERYLFFNAVETSPGVFDREYQASDFADYFGSVLAIGLISAPPVLEVGVEAGTLNTVLSVGKAIIKGPLYENTTPLTLTHSIPEATLDRIDRIVLRLDTRNQSRYIRAFVIEGTPSENPVAPSLQRDNFVHEISLAQIRVRKNTVQLLPSDLIDERLNEELCGFVNGLGQIPTEQFEAEWRAFMDGIIDEGFATVESVQAVDTKVDDLQGEVTTHLAEDATDAHNISNITGLQTALNGKQNALPAENRRKITYGTAEPTGGVDEDIYLQLE